MPDAALPLLKWAGGKRQLLPQLRRFYPPVFGRYLEPFLGSGAVFFDLHGGGWLDGRDASLIDSNADLIGCYETVRDRPEAVARALAELDAGHRHGGQAHYYEVRDRRFNPARHARRHADGRITYTPVLAAMLIYLNRTGWNGLFRVNARGGFNVPAGRYDNPRVVDRERLFRVAEALARRGTSLEWGSFERAGDLAGPDDFVYLDPPYAPLTATARFTAYTASGFQADDQARLQRLVLSLARRGSYVLLSNSTSPAVAALYETAQARRAGLRTFRVPARRAINSDAARRGPIEEFVITNIDAADSQGAYAPGSQTSSRHAGQA